MICQRSDVIAVRSLETLPKIFLVREGSTKEDVMASIVDMDDETQRKKEKDMILIRWEKTLEKSIILSLLFLGLSTTIHRFGWWIVALLDT